MSKKLIEETLTTIQILKKEIYEYFISQMLLDPEADYIKYGNLKIKYELLRNNSGTVTVVMDRYIEYFTLNIKKHKFNGFFVREKRTLDSYLENELYNLFIKRDLLIKKQEELKKSQQIINNLPIERKKQFIREQKLERIMGENE